MLIYHWKHLSEEIQNLVETEEWVGIPERKKQQMLSDLKDPENMETTLHYSRGCDMIKLKVYRPKGPTVMNKFVKWIFILGIGDAIDKWEKSQSKSDKKSCQ